MSRSPSVKVVLGAATALVLLALCASALAWHLDGGRWFVVKTASMGQAAPVGTLLLTKHTSVADVQVGDIITFRAPSSGQVYSHRVIEKTDDLRTQGDINSSADPWTLTDANLIGKVQHRLWGCGWILRGVPLVLIGLAVVWLLTAFLTQRWRSPGRVVGTAVTFSLVVAYLRPWVGVERLSSVDGQDGPIVRLVSVGVLPIRASAQGGGSHADLVNGQVGQVTVTKADSHGAYHINAIPHLSLGWWIAIIVVCLLPLLWTSIVGLDPVPESASSSSPPAAEDEDEDADVDSGLAVVES